jgi:hypothetical protein
MSARKKVNQSRPRALACGVALAVAGAVCFNAASDGRPTSARRSSRPPSNSSASVDSPLSPAPSGNYDVGIWSNAPRIRPPSPLPISANRRSIECARWYSNMRKAAILRKRCAFRKQKRHGTKFQSSTIFASGMRTHVRPSNRGDSSSFTSCVEQRRVRRSTNARRLTSSGEAIANARPGQSPKRRLCASITSARGSRRSL